MSENVKRPKLSKSTQKFLKELKAAIYLTRAKQMTRGSTSLHSTFKDWDFGLGLVTVIDWLVGNKEFDRTDLYFQQAWKQLHWKELHPE